MVGAISKHVPSNYQPVHSKTVCQNRDDHPLPPTWANHFGNDKLSAVYSGWVVMPFVAVLVSIICVAAIVLQVIAYRAKQRQERAFDDLISMRIIGISTSALLIIYSPMPYSFGVHMTPLGVFMHLYIFAFGVMMLFLEIPGDLRYLSAIRDSFTVVLRTYASRGVAYILMGILVASIWPKTTEWQVCYGLLGAMLCLCGFVAIAVHCLKPDCNTELRAAKDILESRFELRIAGAVLACLLFVFSILMAALEYPDAPLYAALTVHVCIAALTMLALEAPLALLNRPRLLVLDHLRFLRTPCGRMCFYIVLSLVLLLMLPRKFGIRVPGESYEDLFIFGPNLIVGVLFATHSVAVMTIKLPIAGEDK